MPVGEVGELVVRPVQPVDLQQRLLRHAGEDRRSLAQPLVPHRRRAPPDEDGWFYFVDRYKDALRRRGENISSYEVEQAILGHPAVVECAVDRRAGRRRRPARTRSWPSSSSASTSTPADILDWCDGRIPAFAIPRFLRIVDALPKTPSEKVRKAVLREDGITADTYDRAAVAVPDGRRYTRKRDDMDFSTEPDCTRTSATPSATLCKAFPDEYWMEHDESNEFPWEFYNAVAEGGWLGLTIPEEYGGGGLGRHRGGHRRAGDRRLRRRHGRLQRRAHRHLRLRADHPPRQRGPEASASCRGW